MICEFRNSFEKFNCYVIGVDPKCHVTKETYLNNVIITILMTLFIMILIVWWIIPLRMLGKYVNPKFVCNNYIKE